MQWTNHLDCLFAHRNGGFQPEMTELKLEGQSVVDLALEASRMPVTLAEVQAHLMEADPTAYKVNLQSHMYGPGSVSCL